MITSTTIINKIRTNERFAKVQRAHEVLSAKYGEVIIAGGCLVDCYFDKDFYDFAGGRATYQIVKNKN